MGLRIGHKIHMADKCENDGLKGLLLMTATSIFSHRSRGKSISMGEENRRESSVKLSTVAASAHISVVNSIEGGKSASVRGRFRSTLSHSEQQRIK